MFITTMEVNSERKLKKTVFGKQVSEEGKKFIFHCQPCSTLTLKNYIYLLLYLRRLFKILLILLGSDVAISMYPVLYK